MQQITISEAPVPPSATAIYLDSAISIATKWQAYKTDLSSNPIRTAFGTPKAIHNLALCGICQIIHAGYIGKFFDCIGAVAKRCGIKPNRDWFANYYLFGAEILLFGTILPSPQLTMYGIQFGGIVWGAAVGAMIQGYDNCKWQKLISKYNFFAAAVGTCNGALCCAAELGISGALKNFMPPSLAETISFVVTWAGSSKLMCKIEEIAFKQREKCHSSIVAPSELYVRPNSIQPQPQSADKRINETVAFKEFSALHLDVGIRGVVRKLSRPSPLPPMSPTDPDAATNASVAIGHSVALEKKPEDMPREYSSSGNSDDECIKRSGYMKVIASSNESAVAAR